MINHLLRPHCFLRLGLIWLASAAVAAGAVGASVTWPPDPDCLHLDDAASCCAESDLVLLGTDGPDLLTGGNQDTLCAFAQGSGDQLHGKFGDDYLSAGPGDDHLQGHHGSDFLRGGPGDDQLVGGTGDDPS